MRFCRPKNTETRWSKDIFILCQLRKWYKKAPGCTQPPIWQVTRSLSLLVKRPGHEADHWHSSSAKFKNDGDIPSLSWISSWHGELKIRIKHRKTVNVKSTNFLGVVIGNSLSWEVHNETTCIRISRNLFTINRLFKIHHMNVRILFYGYTPFWLMGTECEGCNAYGRVKTTAFM
jgi:hypothetical protein